MKNLIKRKEALKTDISEIRYHATKHIWDVDYMSTSNDEDNDSEPDEEEQVQAVKAKKPAKGDVIKTLIEKDDDLL
jgi:hypothetical protein